MAVTFSNTIFFEMIPDAVDTAGWEIQVFSHADFSTLLAIIPRHSALAFSVELSGEGTGSITLDADDELFTRTLSGGAPASDLLAFENLWCAFQHGQRYAAWLGQTVQEDVITEDGTRAVTISGPGAARTLTWAQVLPGGFPVQQVGSIDPTKPVNIPTQFPIEPLFAVWLTLLAQAQTRGTIPFVTTMFDGVGDSGGVAWADTNWTGFSQFFVDQGTGRPIFTPVPGQNYYDLLVQISGQDSATASPLFGVDWYLHPDFRLDVRQSFGAHLENTVVLFQTGEARNIQRTRVRDTITNLVVVQDDLGEYSIASDPTSIASWHQREQYQVNQEVQARSAILRPQIASTLLAIGKDEVSSWTVTVDGDRPGCRPFEDYFLGDWVSLESSPGVLEAVRVLVIAIGVDQDGVETVQLTLQTKLAFLQKQLAQQLVNIKNTIVNDGALTLAPIASPSGVDLVPVFNPTTGDWVPMPISSLPGGGAGGTGTGTGGGIRVFIQPSDPAAQANPGDFWVIT
jgi:hypothetical protein